MKKSSLILILNLFLLQGCTLFGGGGDNAQNTSPPSNPTPGNQQKTPDNSTNENTEESDILGEPGDENTSNGVPVARGLIPSINPKSREAKVIKGRNDPFSLVEVTPIVNDPSVLSSTNSDDSKDDSVPKPGEIVEPPSVALSLDAMRETKYCTTQSAQKGGVDFIPPPPPEPREAKSVLVSGIMNLDGENIAIIKTDDRDYSYNITEGTSLYGGQVFVKSINSKTGDFSVILEQYGQEIIRKVGEIPEIKEKKSDDDSGFQIVKPKGPEIFGYIRGLLVTSLNLEQDEIIVKDNMKTSITQNTNESVKIYGTICNDNDFTIEIEYLEFQFEDTKGIVLGSGIVDLEGELGFILKPGQIGEFDGSIYIKDRLAGDVNVKFRGWKRKISGTKMVEKIGRKNTE